MAAFKIILLLAIIASIPAQAAQGLTDLGRDLVSSGLISEDAVRIPTTPVDPESDCNIPGEGFCTKLMFVTNLFSTVEIGPCDPIYHPDVCPKNKRCCVDYRNTPCKTFCIDK